MNRWFAHVWLAASMVGIVAMAQGTRLANGDKVLFESPVPVTFGASYGERVIRATLVATAEAQVSLRVEQTPRNVFLNEEPLAPTAWKVTAGLLSLTVPAGTSELQVRFDDVTSVKPFDRQVPVILAENGAERQIGELTVRVAQGRARGVLPWPGPAGFLQVVAEQGGKPAEGVTIGLANAPQAEFGGAPAFYLQAGDVLTVSAAAPDFLPPLDRVVAKVAATCTETVRVAKDALDWAGSVVVEGEAFSRQGGGEAKASSEHKNTHGGACAFGWGNPGHWLEWTLDVPAPGDYVLTVVGASQEKTVLRSIDLDGKPLPGAPVIQLAGTGGWGRENPDEWQPFQPVDGTGKPVRIALTKGQHILRLTNLLGQHCNVDAILLTPVVR